ncbi:MAG: hypothetical protein PHW60_13110 [Kiritimatiellae bacterium]|nr:hypothetical protein [Kiritimatiellia bacterium]
MTNDAENDVVHLKAGEQLPAVPVSSPTIEILKQLLEQMLENERRRLRNEYIRISMLVLVLLAVAVGGGLWFALSLLDQLRAERQTAERSLQVLLQRVAPEPSSALVAFEKPAPPAPALRADTNTVQAQADIHRILSDMEAKKQLLADMLKSQNALTKNLLQNRDNELQILHERMKEVQRKVMNAAPPEERPAKETKAQPAIEEVTVNSLTVTTSNAGALRMPIPSP